MERVTGIEGVFFKAKDTAKLAAWYRDQLGFELESAQDAVAVFRWHEPGTTMWSVFLTTLSTSDQMGHAP